VKWEPSLSTCTSVQLKLNYITVTLEEKIMIIEINQSSLLIGRMRLTILGVISLYLLLATNSQARILKTVADSFEGVSREGTITLVETPRRGGTHAFKHTISNSGERAELDGLSNGRVSSGSTRWYGYSFMHMSEPAIPSGDFTILMQHFQGQRDAGLWPCGGGGHKITVAPEKVLQYHLQYQGGGSIRCQRFNLASFNQIKDKWVDVVMQISWTTSSNGFLKLWIRIGGDSGTWEQKINYTGATMASGAGPYTKMGAYVGNPNSG
jgi:hypothetical protein